MATLKLSKPWTGPNGKMKPGDYPIPDKISRVHAQCAVFDGAGKIAKESAEKAPEKGREPRRRGRPPGSTRQKTAAPENKLQSAAPENKTEVDGAAGDSGGDGAGTDAGSSDNLPGEPTADDSSQ